MKFVARGNCKAKMKVKLKKKLFKVFIEIFENTSVIKMYILQVLCKYDQNAGIQNLFKVPLLKLNKYSEN